MIERQMPEPVIIKGDNNRPYRYYHVREADLYIGYLNSYIDKLCSQLAAEIIKNRTERGNDENPSR